MKFKALEAQGLSEFIYKKNTGYNPLEKAFNWIQI